MDTEQKNQTVVNNGPVSNDKTDWAQVAEKLKPTIAVGENGIMPLRDFDPKKPYDDLYAYVKERQTRIDESPLNPEKYIADIEREHKSNQERRETHFEQRVADLNIFHEGIVGLKNAEIQAKDRQIAELKKLEGKYDDERNERLKNLKDYHDQRIIDLKSHHAAEMELMKQLNEFIEKTRNAEVQRVDTLRDKLDEERKGWVSRVQTSIEKSQFWKKLCKF